MATARFSNFISQFGLRCALIVSATALPACGGEMTDEEFENVAEVEQRTGWGGNNNLWPGAIAADPLKRSSLNSYAITTTTNPDPLPL